MDYVMFGIGEGATHHFLRDWCLGVCPSGADHHVFVITMTS